MDFKKLGSETYAALVDLRADIEIPALNVNKMVALMVLDQPEDQRASAISKLEGDLVNHKIGDVSTNSEFRQYLVHLSM